ncbi:hypothetical protein MOJ79_08255 [Calidifontimicrobium sp. SYSU G02091]|uniref:hypothetical protein n=1 Tax=Calidifontimicrobium sp. SYSU G02091 TaxID=2926421 RepID=UPI001F5397DF|nr:hypothetical protein [Calidifontimicrobium sp. SYSU G02091]MCI1191832.1 hypothetical protein [Calidifontimicrobium sp. SYSU G02091]
MSPVLPRLLHAVAPSILAPSALALAAALACAPAAALSIGSARTPIVIGQPLNLALPIQLAAGEVLERDCVKVDVTLGESRLARELLAVGLEPAADPARVMLRVRSGVAVEEPIVSLTVAAGCPARLVRSFVLFPELPAVAAASEAAVPTAAEAPVPVAPVVTSPSAPAEAAASVAAEPAAAHRSPPVREARTAAATAARAERHSTRAERPRAGGKAQPRTPTTRTAARPVQPRLQLELLEPAADVQAAQARAEAAEQALHAAQAAAAQAQQRIAELEAALARRETDAKADRAAIQALQRDLAEVRSQAAWWPLVAGVLAASTLLSAGLAWRTRQQAQRAWWHGQAGGDGATTTTASHVSVPTVATQTLGVESAPHAAASAEGARAWPAAPVAAARPTGADVAPAAPVAAHADANTLQPVALRGLDVLGVLGMSVDEQIDLDQQVEFLAVLGQDEAAVELLRDRLRRSAGRAPMPYLRLFDLYRRLGERESYERLAARFAEHFNARAPAWEDAAAAQRGLDACACLATIEAQWSDAVAVQRTIESLLLPGASDAPPFDLPAFDDLLLLYQVARERALEAGAADVAISAPLELALVDDDAAPAARPAPKARRPRRKASADTGGREPRRDREVAPDFSDVATAASD